MLAKQRLAEVRDGTAWKAADEPLAAGDADARPVDLDDDVSGVEHRDAGTLELGGHFLLSIPVPVVVAEHGDDRHRQRAASVRQHGGLAWLAVRGEVAREKHQVALRFNRSKGRREALADRLLRVDVAGSGDANGHRRSFPDSVLGYPCGVGKLVSAISSR